MIEKNKITQEIIISVAASTNDVIGNNGEIPWHIKEDFLRFKNMTMGYPCIMGRKTYESLPKKPLPGRENIVLSRNATYEPVGAVKFSCLEEALHYCAHQNKVFICGGESVYKEAMTVATRIELTRVHTDVVGDSFFFPIDTAVWEIENDISNEEYSFITYKRK